MNARKQFQIIAIGEGFSWLGLLVTMYLKYGHDLPEPNKIVGYIHGFLFMAFCFYLAYFLFEEKWPLKKCIILFILAFLPFGTFWAEKKYLRKQI
jgi:integral membrane protein